MAAILVQLHLWYEYGHIPLIYGDYVFSHSDLQFFKW